MSFPKLVTVFSSPLGTMMLIQSHNPPALRTTWVEVLAPTVCRALCPSRPQRCTTASCTKLGGNYDLEKHQGHRLCTSILHLGSVFSKFLKGVSIPFKASNEQRAKGKRKKRAETYELRTPNGNHLCQALLNHHHETEHTPSPKVEPISASVRRCPDT